MKTANIELKAEWCFDEGHGKHAVKFSVWQGCFFMQTHLDVEKARELLSELAVALAMTETKESLRKDEHEQV